MSLRPIHLWPYPETPPTRLDCHHGTWHSREVPGLRPSSPIIEIKRNLQDRYKSGYPILIELLQNADDAGASRVRLDACPGWEQANNPLLRGPGLLVANDGKFNDVNRKGILSFGESEKAADRAAIGRFGLGQKAVFHLCDAFVVHAFGHDPPVEAPFTANPYLGVPGWDRTQDWECTSHKDAERLMSRAGFSQRALILWLPFRRESLVPAEGHGFTAFQPDRETIIGELTRVDELRLTLTLLRHLKSVEILSDGARHSLVSIDGSRRSGPHEDEPRTRFFVGMTSCQNYDE